MQQILYWRMQVLLLYGGHQKVIDVVGDWYGASNEQQALGDCVESFQGHVISLSPHGWHLSGLELAVWLQAGEDLFFVKKK
jgi:hypothetical protein